MRWWSQRLFAERRNLQMRPGMSDGHQQSLRFRHSGKNLYNYFLYYICPCPLNIIKVFDFDTQVKLTLTSFSINTFFIILVLRAVVLKPGVATHLCVAKILQCVAKIFLVKVFSEWDLLIGIIGLMLSVSLCPKVIYGIY